jgi:serine/threonine-protein kinase
VNVSSGPKPYPGAADIGETYHTAAPQLQAACFTVGRADVESDQPAGEVVDQDPPGNSTASRGSSVTQSVSQGPKTKTEPDVSLQSVADARATLRAAGFKSSVTEQETEDEALDGLVISQDPAGNAQADPKTVVKLTVGTFVPPPDVTTTTTTPPPTDSPPTTTTTQPPPP